MIKFSSIENGGPKNYTKQKRMFLQCRRVSFIKDLFTRNKFQPVVV